MYADQARPFGVFSAAILCAVGLWGLFVGGAHAWYWIAAAIAAAVVTTLYPRVWLPVLRIWMPVAHVLGWINTRLLLGVVFFIMIVPMSILVRLFRHDPLRLRGRRGESEWIRRDKELTPASFKEPF